VRDSATFPALVSVVIPSFNYGRFIGQALDSVLAQSFQSWECLVIDDGSTDDTADIVSAYAHRDSRISYTRQRNAGLSAARNAGLRLARGAFLQLLDADDLLEPGKLERHTVYLQEHPEVGIVYGPARYFHTESPTRHRYNRSDPDIPWMPEISGPGSLVLSVLLKTNIMPVNSPLVRRDVIQRVGYFDERFPALEDWNYWTRCAHHGVTFQFIDHEGSYALVRIHHESMSNESFRMQRALVRYYQATLGLAPDPDTRRTLGRYLRRARKALALVRIEEGAILRGTAAMVRAALSGREYSLAVKFIGALMLAPVLGRRRFAAWASGGRSLKKGVKSRLLRS
jgi:glycosyltransferase involved in cell wall biosynthesis